MSNKPNWDGVKKWCDYEKVVMVCHVAFNHWVTCCLNLAKSYIMVYDSTQHNYDMQRNDDRKTYFIPHARAYSATTSIRNSSQNGANRAHTLLVMVIIHTSKKMTLVVIHLL